MAAVVCAAAVEVFAAVAVDAAAASDASAPVWAAGEKGKDALGRRLSGQSSCRSGPVRSDPTTPSAQSREASMPALLYTILAAHGCMCGLYQYPIHHILHAHAVDLPAVELMNVVVEVYLRTRRRALQQAVRPQAASTTVRPTQQSPAARRASAAQRSARAGRRRACPALGCTAR